MMMFVAQAGEFPPGAEAAIAIFGIGLMLVSLVVAVATIIGMWKTFEKAGKPGWAAIIPIYNLIVLLEVAGKPIWWIVLLIIPFVSIVIVLLVLLDVAKNFGKSPVFGLGLLFLGFIFFPILGFGDAQYRAVN